MIRTGLWLELEAAIAHRRLGLGSLLGQRTVSVIIMLVYEVILTHCSLRHTSRTSSTCNVEWWGSRRRTWTERLPPVFGGNGPQARRI